MPNNRRDQLRTARAGMFNNTIDPANLPVVPADEVTRRAYGERALADLNALDALQAASENEELLALRSEVQTLREELETRTATPENALITTEDGSRALGRFRLTRTALLMPEDVTDEELLVMGDLLKQMHGAMQFWIGDFANAFHDGYGNKYDALAKYFGIEKVTLENWAWVCRKMTISLRNEKLGFSHHYAVAGLPDKLKGREEELLNVAAENEMSVDNFRKYIKSLIPHKAPASSGRAAISRLFEKERAPRNSDLRKIAVKASRGDEAARLEAKRQIEEYTRWLHDVAQSLGLE